MPHAHSDTDTPSKPRYHLEAECVGDYVERVVLDVPIGPRMFGVPRDWRKHVKHTPKAASSEPATTPCAAGCGFVGSISVAGRDGLLCSRCAAE